MNLEAMQSRMQSYRVALEQELRAVFQRFLPGPAELDVMLQYHMGWMNEDGTPVELYAGKQIRPILLLLSTQAAGGDWRAALPAAGAIELVHNFSLIHDDIEDDSPLRRGRPTLWKVWDAPLSINAGDTMFVLAHMALWRLSETGVSSDRIVEVLRVFEQTNLLLTRGQHLDMSFEHMDVVEVDAYLKMVGGKSAALISGAMEIGAIIAGLKPEECRVYADFGFNLGLAFQIQDDILGIWGEPSVTGKSAATDILSKKKSLPVLFGLEQSPEFQSIFQLPVMTEKNVVRAVELLDQLGIKEKSSAYAQGYRRKLDELRSAMHVSDVRAADSLFLLSESLFGRSV